jgi:nitrilase
MFEEDNMKIAAIQAAPVYLNRKATTDKVIGLMEDASSKGAQLCAFPETFLSGYPIWVYISNGSQFNEPEHKKAYAAYVDSAVEKDGPEMQAIIEASRKCNMFTYLGFVELSNSGGTVYCSLAAIHPQKGMVSLHRKLMPTHAERMVWGTGDGHGLLVHDWAGWRVGGLNCWENWMPLSRFSLYAQGEQLHIATWPGATWLTQDITRFVAMEGRLYAISVSGLLREKDIPDSFNLKKALMAEDPRLLNGGTYIVGPDGMDVAGPVEDEETIVFADLDLEKVREERQNFDPAGHYNRSDVFDLKISRRRLDPLGSTNSERPPAEPHKR